MMMTLDGECRLADVPRELYERLTRELTVLNPAWQTALRLGRPTYGIKKHLLLYRVENSELILPRGMAMQVWARKPRGAVSRDCTHPARRWSLRIALSACGTIRHEWHRRCWVAGCRRE